MRFTSKGIGWLIAGGIICASAIGSDGFASAAGTFMIGLVFIAVYFIKQFFEPAGTGWFIAGGILLAFCVETMIGVTGGMIKDSLLDREGFSDTLVTLIIAAGCLFAFYKKNKSEIDDMTAGMPAEYEPDIIVASEEAPEDDNAPEIEFETRKSEDKK